METSISECTSSDAREAAKLIAGEGGRADAMTADGGSDAVIGESISLVWSWRLYIFNGRFKCMDRGVLWFPGDNIQMLIASANVGDKNLEESAWGN